MQLWTFLLYRRPQLCVDAIEQDGCVVTLRAGSQSYRFAFDDADGAAQTASDLTSLRDAGAPLWDRVCASAPNSAWHALGTFLDTRSLIREALDDAGRALSMQARRVQDHVSGTHGAVMDRIAPDERAEVTAIAAHLCRIIDQALAAGSSFFRDGDPFDAAVQSNFYLGLLSIEFEYLRHASPPTLVAAKHSLRRIAGLADGGETHGETANLYDEHDLASHLWLVGVCVLQSVNSTAALLRTAAMQDVSAS
jgi:hypothetical protein